MLEQPGLTRESLKGNSPKCAVRGPQLVMTFYIESQRADYEALLTNSTTTINSTASGGGIDHCAELGLPYECSHISDIAIVSICVSLVSIKWKCGCACQEKVANDSSRIRP
jgi:hypothetical protein